MSDIDIIKHCRVGIIRGIPLYLCLEDGCWLGKSDVREPSTMARKYALSIGGGSGEHPALVVNSAVNCVAFYLRNAGISNKDIDRLARQRTDGYMVYCDGQSKKAWMTAFKADYSIWKSRMTFDRWISSVLGEFAFFMLYDAIPSIKRWRKYATDMYPYLINVDIPWDVYRGNGFDYFQIKTRIAEHAPPEGRREARRP